MFRILNVVGKPVVAAAFAAALVIPLTNARAQNGFNVLYAFPSGGNNGANPWANLIMDNQGDLYGTTEKGGGTGCGGDGCGTVFKLAPPYGPNSETVLYSFSGSDGAAVFAGLIMDSQGNLYGTASQGGGTGCGGIGCGTLFKLAPPYGQANGTVLYSFSGSDGLDPSANLIMDNEGDLYGTTEGGGASGEGAVFRLVPPYGQGNETVLYSFNGGHDGISPSGSLIMDSQGNLYGTTAVGGPSDNGTVFRLAPPYGQNSETQLYLFSGGKGGAEPHCNLIMDSQGNLYGTTAGGGMTDHGVVFKLAPPYGQNSETVLYTFTFVPAIATSMHSKYTGMNPVAGPIMDSQGNLYGTTQAGGTNGAGVVFKLAPPYGHGNETTLYNFTAGSDGEQPTAGLIMDSQGNLYGTATYGGGTHCFNGFACGTVFELRE